MGELSRDVLATAIWNAAFGGYGEECDELDDRDEWYASPREMADAILAALPAHPPAPTCDERVMAAVLHERAYWQERLAAPPAPLPLDAAWAEAEAALPQGWSLHELRHDPSGGWVMVAAPPFGWGIHNGEVGYGATPAAALRALAARLRDRAQEPVKVHAKAQGSGDHPVSRTNGG